MAVRLTLLAWLPMLAWYAALRPGLMSSDSLTVWQQATGGNWVDLHPPAYTAALWVSSRLLDHPGLVTLGQSLFLAASIVALARSVLRLGAPGWAVATLAGTLMLSPMVGLFAMSLWKDVPYTAAVLLASARVVELAATPARTPEVVRPLLWSLTGWLVVATLFRQNGIIFAAVVLVVLAVVLRGGRRSVALAGALVVLSLVLAKAVVYPLAGVTPSPTQAPLAMFLHDVAAVARTDPSVFESEDRALLGLVAPFQTWREISARFGCASANWQWGGEFDWRGVEGRADDYVQLWAEVIRERPRRVASNRLCVGAIAWRPDTVGTVYTVSAGIDANQFGLRTRPLVGGLDGAAREVIDATNDPSVQWALWRGPTWIYASWGVLALVAVRQRRPALILAGLPGLALPLSVFPFNPAQDARYMFAGVVLGALLLPVAGLARDRPAVSTGDDRHRLPGRLEPEAPTVARNGSAVEGVEACPLVRAAERCGALESEVTGRSSLVTAGQPPFGRLKIPEPRHSGVSELTILMPCLDEAETIAACVGKARRFLEDRGIDGEVLVADNGSTDGSSELAAACGARVIHVSQKGYGSALLAGIRLARGRYVIMGDADDSYDFSSLDAFVDRLRAGVQVVMGNRFDGSILPGAMPPLHRYVGNPVLSRLGRLFFKVPCKDFHCGLRGFHRDAVLALNLRSPGMEFASELVVKAKLRQLSIAEVPITLHPDGRSRPPHLRSWRDGWRHLRFLLLYSPRWLFLYPGVILTVMGGLLTAALIVSPMRIGVVRLGEGALVASSVLTAIGYQAVLFACLTKVHAQVEGFLPEDPRFNRAFRYVRLETGLAAGFVLFATGSVFAVVAYFAWRDASWGAREATTTVRFAVPAALGLVLGSQTVLSSFFLSILGLRRVDVPAAEDAEKDGLQVGV